MVTGIRATGGGWSGGKIRAFEPGSTMGTVLKTAAGSDYVIPPGQKNQVFLPDPFEDGLAVGVVCTNGGNYCFSRGSLFGTTGIAIDLRRNIILPIEFPKTEIQNLY